MTTFVALGDSITEGMGDPVPGGWRGKKTVPGRTGPGRMGPGANPST